MKNEMEADSQGKKFVGDNHWGYLVTIIAIVIIGFYFISIRPNIEIKRGCEANISYKPERSESGYRAYTEGEYYYYATGEGKFKTKGEALENCISKHK